MRAAVIEDQNLVRVYLGGLLRRHFGAADIVEIDSMAQLRASEERLAGVGLILFDIDLNDGSTLDWAAARAARPARCPMVAISSQTGVFPLKTLQAAGISVVHKNDGEGELVEMIRVTLGGSFCLSRCVMALLAGGGRDPHSPMKILGTKEIQVLALLGQRFNNAQAAEVIGCSVATVADHRKRIMRKLDLHRIEDLIDYAIRHGLVHDSQAAGARAEIKP